MKKNLALISSIFLLMIACNPPREEMYNQDQFLQLWYQQPARQWIEALPVGNGRLGAMVFGHPTHERIQLNEESLWAGTRINNNNPKALAHLDRIRQLLLNDQNEEALELAQENLLGTPPRIRSYQTLGDLFLDFELDSNLVENFKRDLDLTSGIATTNFSLNGAHFTREVFVSAPDDMTIIHLSSEEPLSFNIQLSRKQDAQIYTEGIDLLVMEGQIEDQPDSLQGPGGKHMRFASLLKVITDGKTGNSNTEQLSIKDASATTLLFTAATDYSREDLGFDRSMDPLQQCRQIIQSAAGKSFQQIKADHLQDHQAMFNRVELDLVKLEQDTIPTDQRLNLVKAGLADPHLVELYFQYGRYLLMGSSRKPGRLPANLQGIWNEHYNAPWNSDFHTNINLQMNYWPAEVGNLPETLIPYVNFVDALTYPGKVTAREMYGASGWTMHHVTDPFGRTGLADAIEYGMFPLAAAWITFPVWRHYQYNQDTSYLKGKAWPIIKEATLFVLDFLFEDETGQLITAPSYSPENTFYLPGSEKQMRLTYAPTMDIMIINELFDFTQEAALIVGGEGALIQKIKSAQMKLPAVQIGADGTIQEWIKDYKEVEPGHRHISHLLALHPGSRINPGTHDLFAAAKQTIARRLEHGGGHTGWSRAWIINFYARLLDPENAYNHVLALLQKSTLPNLFDTHPPFQIDGNFGGTAGIAEMLLQSHNEKINLLPALPRVWNDGEVKGLKARGDFVVNIQWNDGRLTEVSVLSNKGSHCILTYNDQSVEFPTDMNTTYRFNGSLNPI